MSNPNFREPTNEQLWAQPPAGDPSSSSSQGIMPFSSTPPLTPPATHASTDRTGLALAIVSIALGIPLTAIGASTAGFAGLLVVWIGIVLVNLSYNKTRHK